MTIATGDEAISVPGETHSRRLPEAVIFDMDGVLADTEPLHERALAAMLAGLGHTLSAEDFQNVVGLSRQAFWEAVARRFVLPGDPVSYRPRYVEELLPMLATGVRPAEGVPELVGALQERHIPLAVASSSGRETVERTLAALGIRDAFSAIVTGDDITRGKPGPETYLEAARRLGVDPRQCVAVEDSPHGVEAARRAEMRVVAIRTRYTAEAQLLSDVTIDSLDDLRVEDLAELVSQRPPVS